MQLVILENQARFIEASIPTQHGIRGVPAVAVLFAFLKDFSHGHHRRRYPAVDRGHFAPVGCRRLAQPHVPRRARPRIGMLADNAVVVLENIQVFVERGMSARRSGARRDEDGRHRVTLTTVACSAHHLRRGRCRVDFRRPGTRGGVQPARILVVALLFAHAAATDIRLPAADSRPRLREVSGRPVPLHRPASPSSFAPSAASGGGSCCPGRWLDSGPLGFELLAFVTVWASAPPAGWPSSSSGSFAAPPPSARAGRRPFSGWLPGPRARFTGGYPARPALVLGAAVASVIVSVPLGSTLGQALISCTRDGSAEVALPVGTPVAYGDFTPPLSRP